MTQLHKLDLSYSFGVDHPQFREKDLPRFKPKSFILPRKAFNCYALAMQMPEKGFLIPGDMALSEKREDRHGILKAFRENRRDILERMECGPSLPHELDLCDMALQGALLDGCKRVHPGHDVPEGYYPGAIIGFDSYVDEQTGAVFYADSHFMAMFKNAGDDGRKEKGYVGWLQKPGELDITRRDHAGDLISDPRHARYKRPGRFHTFIAIPCRN